MNNKFQEQKATQLLIKDKSHIGKWDSKIKCLCEKINKKKNYYTTSSCSGRVVLLKETGKKQKDAFLFRSHKLVSFLELKKALNNMQYSGLVQFKQSPCILHVACKDIDSAQKLVTKAKLCGWKRSGIMSLKRIIVELMSTEHLDFPIMGAGKVLVDDDFLKLVVEHANLRLSRVWEKINRLEEAV